MKHGELDGSGRKSHYELENDLAAIQGDLATLLPGEIPEIALTFTTTVTLPAGAKYCYLPRDHFYEAGRSPRHITQVLVDGVDRTAQYGVIWSELARGSLSPTDNWPGNGLAGFDATYGDGTVKDLTWCLRRHVTTAQEVWAVTWVEKRMLFNPVQVRECVLQEGTTTLDLSVAWVNQKRYDNLGTLVHDRNTNGFIASGIPAGYKLLVWTCQIGRNEGSVLSRGRHWRPCSRMAALAGTDYRIFSGDFMKTSRLYGVGLYNPTTGARSAVKVAGYRGTVGGSGPGFRVLK